MRRKVDFSTEDGTTLRGYVHSSGSDARPGIVTCHGFGGVKSHIDHYAALFAEAGPAVSLYDHRGFGTSDGAPRLEVNPYRQLADWRDAITFATDLPEIDVTFLDIPDPLMGEYGARGIGEIGMAGVAPAITAAVYHATGVRVRELPVRIEDLLKSRVEI